MKQDDIQQCSLCGKGIGHKGDIHFYRVKIEHCVVMVDAVRRHAGLEMMLGSPAIARAMGTDEDIAKVTATTGGWICADCALRGPNHCIAGFFETLPEA